MSDWTMPDGTVLTNVHSKRACSGEYCVIHKPLHTRMDDWPLIWRDDRGIFERICLHGVGHPAPDQFDYWAKTDQEGQGVHGCCLCCVL